MTKGRSPQLVGDTAQRARTSSGVHRAQIVFAGDVSYGASKHALESCSRAAAKELGKYGITVNIVSLGAVQTGWISPEMEEEIVASYPLGRIGQPEDVADVIVFLASEQARWVTGQLIYVGGGHAMHL